MKNYYVNVCMLVPANCKEDVYAELKEYGIVDSELYMGYEIVASGTGDEECCQEYGLL